MERLHINIKAKDCISRRVPRSFRALFENCKRGKPRSLKQICFLPYNTAKLKVRAQITAEVGCLDCSFICDYFLNIRIHDMGIRELVCFITKDLPGKRKKGVVEVK
jgi:hypothetical protein